MLGANHVDTAACLNNLGELLVQLNRLDEAEPMLKEALAARRITLGNLHPGAGRDARRAGGARGQQCPWALCIQVSGESGTSFSRHLHPCVA